MPTDFPSDQPSGVHTSTRIIGKSILQIGARRLIIDLIWHDSVPRCRSPTHWQITEIR